jgi:hypothetical protein
MADSRSSQNSLSSKRLGVERPQRRSVELCGNLGDDVWLKAAYRGGCRACQNLPKGAIRHAERYHCHRIPYKSRTPLMSHGTKHRLRSAARCSCPPPTRHNRRARYDLRPARPWSHRSPGDAVGSTSWWRMQTQTSKASRSARDAACVRST